MGLVWDLGFTVGGTGAGGGPGPSPATTTTTSVAYSTPSHWQSRGFTLAVFEPLVRGSDLISDDLGFAVESILPVRTALGWFWSLRFSFKDRQSAIEEWIDDGLGRHVKLYNPALALIWEGFASQVQANIGGLSIVRGPLLDTVTNKVRCAYSTVDTSVTPPAVGIREFTDWYEDADSQEKYGIVERIISIGGATAANAAQIAQTVLEENKEPATDEQDNIEGGVEPSVTVECLGYAHWLNAYAYNSTSTGTQNADVKLEAVLGADPNGIFSTDYTYVDSNATAVGAWENDNRKAWSVVKGITSVGDSSYNRWLFGLYEDRTAFYKSIPTDVRYQRSLSDPEQAIEVYGSGSRVHPWDVEPGEWLFYTDLLIGRSEATRRADPRYLFSEQANHTLPWGLTLDGAKVHRLDQLMAQLGLGGAGA